MAPSDDSSLGRALAERPAVAVLGLAIGYLLVDLVAKLAGVELGVAGSAPLVQ